MDDISIFIIILFSVGFIAYMKDRLDEVYNERQRMLKAITDAVENNTLSPEKAFVMLSSFSFTSYNKMVLYIWKSPENMWPKELSRFKKD